MPISSHWLRNDILNGAQRRYTLDGPVIPRGLTTAMAKKKILIVNKFLYPRGGDCIVALSEASLLRGAGYDVELWGMSYPDNIPLPLADTFASEVSFGGGLTDKLRAMERMMGMGDVKKAFRAVLDRFEPDIVHFHNIHSYLSPAIVGMAKARGCRTLWTMHDYKLICPAYSCLDGEGRPCTECLTNPSAVVRRRCMKGSLIQSLAAAAEARRWRVQTLAKMTDYFICPSHFMAAMIERGGVGEEQIRVIPNYLDPQKAEIFNALPADTPRTPGLALYVGRLSAEKGVAMLLDVARREISQGIPLRLELYGTGPLEPTLRAEYGSTPGIEFKGHADAETLARRLAVAAMTVCPSQWYENNPLSVIESLSAGTPVVGAEIGGIPELIRPEDGLLYDPFSPEALAGALRGMLARSFDNAAIRRSALKRFSPDTHLNALRQLIDP